MQQFTEMFNMLCNREARFNGANWGESGPQIEADAHALAVAGAKLVMNEKCTEVLECLKDRMEAPDVQKRLLAFWVLDRVFQEVSSGQQCAQTEAFNRLVEKQLYGLLRLIAGSTVDQPGIKQLCLGTVQDILKSWIQKRMLKPAVIANAIKQISGSLQVENKNNVPRPVHYYPANAGAGNYDRQQMERMQSEMAIPHEEDLRHEEFRRLTEKEKQARDLMEQQRSSQKREKLEKALRPLNEQEDGEFSEMWNQVLRQEQERERFANAEEDFWARWRRSNPLWKPEFPKGANGKVLYGRQAEVMAEAERAGSSDGVGRKKKRDVEENAAVRRDKEVWVWELDALTGERALWSQEGEGPELGDKLKVAMFDLADRLFFFQELEEFQPFHLLEQQRFDDHRDLNGYDFSQDGGVKTEGARRQTLLAYRYRRVQQLYDYGISRLLSEVEMAKINALYEDYKSVLRKSNKSSCEGPGGLGSPRTTWIEATLACLHRIKQGGGKNVVICSAPLIPSLAKCQLAGLGAEFPAHKIYSGDSNASMTKCFEDIVQRYGADCDYHAIYDNEGQATEVWRDLLPQMATNLNVHLSQLTAVEDIHGILRCLDAPKRPRPTSANKPPSAPLLGSSPPNNTPAATIPVTTSAATPTTVTVDTTTTTIAATTTSTTITIAGATPPLTPAMFTNPAGVNGYSQMFPNGTFAPQHQYAQQQQFPQQLPQQQQQQQQYPPQQQQHPTASWPQPSPFGPAPFFAGGYNNNPQNTTTAPQGNNFYNPYIPQPQQAAFASWSM